VAEERRRVSYPGTESGSSGEDGWVAEAIETRTEALRFGDVVYVENFAVSDLAARLDEALHERARLSQRWADVESLGHLPSLTWPG
jgi:hypothetical protein